MARKSPKQNSLATAARPDDVENRESDRIDIPRKARELPLPLLSISVRLKTILEAAGFRKLGDLHGARISEFAQFRHGGPKAQAELRKLVLRVQTGAKQGDLSDMRDPSAAQITVPPAARGAKFSDLPISVRLDHVMEKEGLTTLGQLQNLRPTDLLAVKAFGKKTMAELMRLIERAAAGEFDVPNRSDPAWSLAELLAVIDKALAQLPEFSEKALRLRFAAEADRIVTLEEVGQRMKRTREYIRQVTEQAVDTVRRSGGPKLGHAVDKLVARCAPPAPPLTAELLTQWVKSDPARFHYPMFFYLRLLNQLTHRLHIWPNARWNPETERLLGKLPDAEIARRMGRSVGAVTSRRRKYGLDLPGSK